MTQITSADLRYKVSFLNRDPQTTSILVIDRVAADALSRKHGYSPDAHEIKMYLAAFAALKRAGAGPDTWDEFAQTATDVAIVDVHGNPVRREGAFLVVEDGVVDEDPTQPGA